MPAMLHNGGISCLIPAPFAESTAAGGFFIPVVFVAQNTGGALV